MLTHGSLFSGIGGFDLGFERAGIKTIWQVECEPYCLKVLEKHWPNVRRYTDVRSVHGVLAHARCVCDGTVQSQPITRRGEQTDVGVGCQTCLPSVDLLSGGFPCQPFSVAGKRRGTDDDRHLWPQMRRLVEELRPRWVVAENVPGLIKMALDQVLSDLEALGYTVGAVTVPACAVDAPHRRERLWIVGYAEGRGVRCSEASGQGGQSAQPGEDVVHTARHEQGRQEQRAERQRIGKRGEPCDVADAESGDLQRNTERRPCDGNEHRHGRTHQATSARRCGSRPRELEAGWWLPEPNVGRVAHGVPARVDRLKCLGNAIVPKIAEEIGRMIVQAELG